MSKQRWFRDRSFIVSLVAGIGAALLAAAEEITRRLGKGHRKKKKGGKPARNVRTK